MKTIKLFFLRIFSFLTKDLEEKVTKIDKDVKNLKQQLTPKRVQELKDPSLILSLDGRFKIRTERHPKNIDVLVFHFHPPLFSDYQYSMGAICATFPLANQCISNEDIKKFITKIFETQLCSQITVDSFYIEFIKSGASDWEDIVPKVIEILFNTLAEKYPAPTSEPVSEGVVEEQKE